jgi:hypothetical protein
MPADKNGMVEAITEETQASEPSAPGSLKLSINVATGIGERLRRLAFTNRVSESSIVEVALTALYEGRDDAEVGEVLREGGASLRRKRALA